MKLLRQWATKDHAQEINALLAKPGVDGDLRKNLEEIMSNLKPNSMPIQAVKLV